MIQIGKYNTRTVVRHSEIGVFLEGDDEWEDFLLPKKYVPPGTQEGDELEVFVYFDSEGRTVSTTLRPHAQVGEFAVMKVTAVEEFGIFLDWGIDKDLFLPFKEQLFKMEVGRSYPVHVYLDKTGRPAASTRINKFVNKARPPYQVGDVVDLLIYQKTDLGFRALINQQYAGVIYKDDLVNNLALCQQRKGFIKNVRPDHKIDLSLRPIQEVSPSELTEKILLALRENQGFLPIHAKTTADVINEKFAVSRKKFKVALGALYKSHRIEMKDGGISLLTTSPTSWGYEQTVRQKGK